MSDDLLEIPPFLRRAAKPGRATAPALPSRAIRQKPIKPPPGHERVTVRNHKYLGFPAGERIVYAKIGWKWVYLWRPTRATRTRIPRKVFDQMVISE